MTDRRTFPTVPAAVAMRAVRRRIAWPAAGFSVLAALLFGATPASAAATAWNTVSQVLAYYPVFSLPKSCHSLSIKLAAGNYRWGLVDKRTSPPSPYFSKYIYLAAGTYSWEDCLTPENNYYFHESTLTPPIPHAPANITVILCGSLPPAGVNCADTLRPGRAVGGNSGTYEWGSYLTPQF